MHAAQRELLDWIEDGRVPSDAVPAALQAAGVTPQRADWRAFFDRVTLWIGAVSIAMAVIFFFAYNWQAMGRFAKFGLVELLILGCLALCWRFNLESAAGRALLMVASLFVGALLALVGQTYQTGADTFELFMAWAVCILPWVLVARFGVLWLFWIGLLNLAAYLYYATFGGLFGLLFSTETMLWTLFALNTLALAAWELAAQSGIDWLRERWSPRVLAIAGGTMATMLALWAIFDSRDARAGTLFIYLIWLGALYLVYRLRTLDLFILAGGVLSGIVVITAALSKAMLDRFDGGSLLFIGMIVIGMSAAGGIWLKNLAKEAA